AALDKIFDPFYTTKPAGKGTGLGLSTVLGIVQGHGGFIDVQSQLGGGSQFTVFLPAIAEAEKPAERAAEVVPRGRGECLLVVDDEQAIRDLARTMLEAYGYRVLTAADGREALAVFSDHRAEVQAVIVDMAMPVMDGPATIRALRRLDPDLRIAVATGLAAGGQGAEVAGVGVQGLIPK